VNSGDVWLVKVFVWNCEEMMKSLPSFLKNIHLLRGFYLKSATAFLKHTFNHGAMVEHWQRASELVGDAGFVVDPECMIDGGCDVSGAPGG
jgi:hypothetical protein